MDKTPSSHPTGMNLRVNIVCDALCIIHVQLQLLDETMVGGYTGNILCVHVSVLLAAVSGAGSIRHSVTCCVNILIVPQVYIYGTMYLTARPAQLPFAPSRLSVRTIVTSLFEFEFRTTDTRLGPE